MKFFIILIFLISFTASANFAKVSEIEAGELKTVFTKMKSCGSDCIRIPSGFNKSFHKIIEEMVNDFTKPNYEAKSEVETCSTIIDDPLTLEIDESKTQEQDCIEKESVLNCPSQDHFTRRSEDNSEAYCTKLLGYEKKLTGRKIVVEDAALKASFEANENAKKAAKQAEKNSIIALKEKLASGGTLTPVELSSVLKYLLKSL